MTPKLVDTTQALAAALAELAASPWVAVDTEFLRERTYYPKLCLLQVATADADFVIDTLRLSDLTSVGEFLADAGRVKIFHAARQDLEALQRVGLSVTRALFDTQTAATLVGHPDQVSYAWLVEHYCQVALDKSQTRTDWTQRPLTTAQLLYAQDDVKYLGTLYQVLHGILAAEGKLDWLWEETASLEPALLSAEDPAEAWRRIRGLGNLPSAVAWARGKALAAWRERAAQRLDIPRGWLLKDEVLLAVAALESVTMPALGALPGVAPATVRRYGSEIARVHAEATVHDAPTLWRLGAEGNRLLTELQAEVKTVAAAVEVSPGLLASRRDLEALILGEPPPRLMQGWRRMVLGDALTARVAQVPLEQRRHSAAGAPRRARRA